MSIFLGLYYLSIYLTKMLGSMIYDKKLLGVCGEMEIVDHDDAVGKCLKFYLTGIAY